MLTLWDYSSRNKSPNKLKPGSTQKQQWRPHSRQGYERTHELFDQHSNLQNTNYRSVDISHQHPVPFDPTDDDVTSNMATTDLNSSQENSLNVSATGLSNPTQLGSALLPDGTYSSVEVRSLGSSSVLFTRCFGQDGGLAEYSCLACNYRSKKICNMKAHVRTHNQEKPFPCPKCSYRANQMSNLKAHVLRHHGIDSMRCFPIPNTPSWC